MPEKKIEYPFIPVFWNGTHKNKGSKKDWTAEDVKGIFSATLAGNDDRIPFTIDHPGNDLPVIGWTDKNNLRIVEEEGKVTIEAKPTEFSKETLEAVKESGRKKISIALRGEDHSIRHIGLVDKPAVQDLPAIPFEETEDIIFSELENNEALFMDQRTANYFNQIGEILSGIRDYFIEDKGIETANQLMQRWNIDWLLKAKADEIKGEINSLFKLTEEGNMPDKPIQETEEFKAVSDENEKLKQELAALQTEKRAIEFQAYLDRDEFKEKLTPAIKAKALRLMTAIHADEEYEFTENEQPVKKTPLTEFKEMLELLPKQVQFSEHAVDGKTGDDDNAVVDKTIEAFNKSRQGK